MKSLKRVLIFDSGVGGLSVYDHIIKLTPTIKCHYLFDNAYFPYGELGADQLTKRLIQLLGDFMLQHPIDLVVIACNTASTIALQSLRQHFSVPIVGVVPAIKPAALATRNNVIGLLATPATIEQPYITTLINKFALDKTVLRIGSTELVKLAEAKLAGKNVSLLILKEILKPWLKNTSAMPDTLVLGCTHFPLLKNEISACFDRPICLVDSGSAVAQRVKQLLTEQSSAENSAHTALQIEVASAQIFYTKEFTDKTHLAGLTVSFKAYGFKQITFCGL